MAKNLADLRFAIKNFTGDSSCIWRFWVTRKGDVYLAMRSLAHVVKLSFHVSGSCRNAIVKERERYINSNNRLIFDWQRLETPSLGSNSISKVAILAFPTDYLSKVLHDISEDVFWLDAAPNGDAIYVEIFFTYESHHSVSQAADQSNMQLLNYTVLPSSEAVVMVSYRSAWGGDDLTMKGGSDTSDIIFSKSDPLNTGRPLRMHMAIPPHDGGFVAIKELGGYAAK